MTLTSNTISLLLCWIVPPLWTPKGPLFPPCLHTQHKEDRNFSPKGLGGPREEVLPVQKSLSEFRRGKSFSKSTGKPYFHGQILSCLFFYAKCFSHCSTTFQSSSSFHIFPSPTMFLSQLNSHLSLPSLPMHGRNKAVTPVCSCRQHGARSSGYLHTKSSPSDLGSRLF